MKGMRKFNDDRTHFFTGREKELSIFRDMIDNRTNSSDKRIIYVTGVGGIGKTTLLRQFSRICRDRSIPTCYVDLRDKDNWSEFLLMYDIRKSLRQYKVARKAFRDFDRTIQRMERLYVNHEDVESIIESLTEVAINQIGPHILSALFSSLTPFVPVIATVGGAFAKQHLPQNGFSQKDIQFLIDAEELINNSFLDGLTNLANRNGKMIVLFFDNIDNISDSLRMWIQNLIKSSKNQIIVLSGRKSLGYDWEPISRITRVIKLKEFNQIEAEEYLRKRKISDERFIRKIPKITKGYPLGLTLAALIQQERNDPSFQEKIYQIEIASGVNDKLLESLRETYSQIIDACSVVRRFNIETIVYLTGKEKYQVSGALKQLRSSSLVVRKEDGDFTIHDVIRHYVNFVLKMESESLWLDLHRKAADYYSTKLHLKKKDSIDWENILIEKAFHSMIVDENTIKHYFPIFSHILWSKPIERGERVVELLNSVELQNPDNIEYADILKTQYEFLIGRWRDVEEKLVNASFSSPLIKQRALLMLSHIYQFSGRDDRAIESLKTLLSQDPHYIEGKYALARAYYTSFPSNSVEIANELVASLNSTHPLFGQTLGIKALALIRLGEWEEALEIGKKVIQIGQRFPNSYVEGMGFHVIGRTHFHTGNWEKAIDNFNKSLEIFRRFGDEHIIGMTLQHRMMVKMCLKDWESAMTDFSESELLLKGREARHSLARLISQKACIYWYQGDEKKAIENWQHSCELIQDTPERPIIQSTINSIRGNILLWSGRPELSIQYFKDAIKLLGDAEEPKVRVRSQIGLSIAYTYIGQFDSAIEFIEQSEKSLKNYSDHSLQAYIKFIQGKIALERRNFTLSTDTFFDSLKESLRYNNYLLSDMENYIIKACADVPGGYDILTNLQHRWVRQHSNKLVEFNSDKRELDIRSVYSTDTYLPIPSMYWT